MNNRSHSPYKWLDDDDDDDAYIMDMDYFVKNLSSIKAKGIRPDVIGSLIAHYASKWVPELSETKKDGSVFEVDNSSAWKKKRFFVETLVDILPLESDAVPCSFLLRLLRVANMVRVESTFREELEKRVSCLLHQASFKDIIIPSFSHTCATLLDVLLFKRLVNRFLGLDRAFRTGASLLKVAKLVDSYLIEAAMDSNLSFTEFFELARALPPHARDMDDGLYHAVDTYLKAHPGVTKQEKNYLWKLINPRKLTPEASIHATQNERLPVRAVIQVLFSEQNKMNRQLDMSGPLNGSKREVTGQQKELKRLKDDVVKLQNQITALQAQMERSVEKKGGFFRWGKLTLMSSLRSGSESGRKETDLWDVGFGRYTPSQRDHGRTKLLKGTTPQKLRRSSMS